MTKIRLFLLLLAFLCGQSLALAQGVNLKTGKPFPRGCVPSPKALRAAAPMFKRPAAAPPAQVAHVPTKLDPWGNDQYGDCVTAEEAFAKGCSVPGGPAGVFIPRDEVVRWARAHGVLNGASLIEVLQGMKAKGFVIGSQTYSDGDFAEVAYDNEGDLKAALAVGPVKIAIDADALPSGAGNTNGWYVLTPKTYRGTDHSIPILGYGKAKWLYEQFGGQLPAGVPPDTEGYIVGTWGTWGFVVYKWIPGCTDEAWVRFPTTVGVPPLPIPNPPPPPGPVPAPPLMGSLYVEKGTIIRGELGLTLPTGKFSYVPTPDGFTAAGVPKFKFIQLAQ